MAAEQPPPYSELDAAIAVLGECDAIFQRIIAEGEDHLASCKSLASFLDRHSSGRVDPDMAERYLYKCYIEQNWLERMRDGLPWFSGGFKIAKVLLQDLEQSEVEKVRSYLKNITAEAKTYVRSTPRGTKSEYGSDLFKRYADVMNAMEYLSGLRFKIER